MRKGRILKRLIKSDGTSYYDGPITVENTEKDALIRLLLDACLESYDAFTCGWIEPRLIRSNVIRLENAIMQSKQSGMIKSADWPQFKYDDLSSTWTKKKTNLEAHIRSMEK